MTRLRAAGALATVVLAVAGCGSDGEDPGSADGTATCDWLPAPSGAEVVDVGTPPEQVSTEGSTTVLMSVGQGDLTLTLDRGDAPCATASMVHLTESGFFDDTPCHRLVDSASFGVLQCGDPTGTGRGGPAYRFAQEVTEETAYPAGTVAMANSGQPGSTGSQFFVCFVDTALSPDYTAVGTLDRDGLAVVQQIAAAGHDGSLDPSPGGGAPNEPVTIESAEVLG